MYGLWLLVLIMGTVGVMLIVLGHISYKLYRHYNDSLKYTYVYHVDDCGEHTTTSIFSKGSFDKKNLSEEQYRHLSKRYNTRKFWSLIDDVREVLYFIGVLLLIITFVIALFAIFLPIGAQQEVLYWQNFVEMVKTTIDGADTYQTVGIAGDIVKYNSWLTSARTSQEMYGNWSIYYGIDLSQLDYIKLGGQ